MPNKNYLKGRRKEWKIMNNLRNKGYDIVMRTRGSRSPIDIVGVDKEDKTITFIQSKPDSMTQLNKNGTMTKAARRIHDELDYLNDEWRVIFKLI